MKSDGESQYLSTSVLGKSMVVQLRVIVKVSISVHLSRGKSMVSRAWNSSRK